MARRATMQDHFTRLASAYNSLRTTDRAPVRVIAEALAGERAERAADVGCGSGRYDLLLLREFSRLHLTCVDANRAMLEAAGKYLRAHGQTRFALRLADAENLRGAGRQFDFIVSLNAIHHFDPVAFLQRAARRLRSGGSIFLYTRLHEQNAGTIWGRYFPRFADKETRLYRIAQIHDWMRELDRLELCEIRLLQHARWASLARLLELAEARHYSTFEFYGNRELRVAIDAFRQRIRARFDDTSRVTWREDHAMIILRAAGSPRRHAHGAQAEARPNA